MKLKSKRLLTFSAALAIMAALSVNNASSEIRRCLNNNDRVCKIYKGDKLKKDGTGAAIVISGILDDIIK